MCLLCVIYSTLRLLSEWTARGCDLWAKDYFVGSTCPVGVSCRRKRIDHIADAVMQWCTMLSSRHRPCVSVNESAGLAVHHSSSRRHRQNNANAMHFIQIERERERENNGLAAFVFCSWFVIRVSWSIEFVSCYYCCCCCGCRRAHTAVSMHFLQNNSRARALLPWTGARAMRKCSDCRVVWGTRYTTTRLFSTMCMPILYTLHYGASEFLVEKNYINCKTLRE